MDILYQNAGAPSRVRFLRVLWRSGLISIIGKALAITHLVDNVQIGRRSLVHEIDDFHGDCLIVGMQKTPDVKPLIPWFVENLKRERRQLTIILRFSTARDGVLHHLFLILLAHPVNLTNMAMVLKLLHRGS